MKKFWLGIVLLAALLVGGLLNAWGMEKSHSHIASLLTQAADLALSGDIARGTEKAAEAQAHWDRYRNAVAAVADHQPLENVEALFAQLKTYGEASATVSFAATCQEASRQVEAVGDAQTLKWQNLL